VSRDVRSRGRLEAGATRAPGGGGWQGGEWASEAGQASSATGQQASEQASKQVDRWRASKWRGRERKGERRRKKESRRKREGVGAGDVWAWASRADKNGGARMPGSVLESVAARKVLGRPADDRTGMDGNGWMGWDGMRTQTRTCGLAVLL